MRSSIKTGVMIILCLLYCAVSLPGYLILRGRIRYNFFCRVTSFFTRLGLWNLDLHATVHNAELLKNNRPMLLVCNHLSYLDIFILSSKFPTLFVSSIELKNTPVLGFFASLGGSLFVERRKIADIKRELGTIAGILKKGLRICFFPEATSSNGLEIKPFKSSLIESAILAGTDVAVLCIKYTEINGAPASSSNLDLICYYGDMYFFPHLKKLLTLKSIKAELSVLDIIPAGKHVRKDICDISYKKISECYFGHPVS